MTAKRRRFMRYVYIPPGRYGNSRMSRRTEGGRCSARYEMPRGKRVAAAVAVAQGGNSNAGSEGSAKCAVRGTERAGSRCRRQRETSQSAAGNASPKSGVYDGSSPPAAEAPAARCSPRRQRSFSHQKCPQQPCKYAAPEPQNERRQGGGQ